MPGLDYHLKILGLSGTPTRAQITKAYRGKINQWHPDKHQHDARRQDAEEAAKLINAAYAFLKSYRFPKAAPPSAAAAPRPDSQFVNRIIPVNSGRIVSVRFDEHTKSFALFFRDGHISRFTKVPRALFNRFLRSRAKEAFVTAHVFNKFPEEKVA